MDPPVIRSWDRSDMFTQFTQFTISSGQRLQILELGGSAPGALSQDLSGECDLAPIKAIFYFFYWWGLHPPSPPPPTLLQVSLEAPEIHRYIHQVQQVQCILNAYFKHSIRCNEYIRCILKHNPSDTTQIFRKCTTPVIYAQKFGISIISVLYLRDLCLIYI